MDISIVIFTLVAGAFLAGFYLMRVHDMAIATFVAVGLNVLVAGIALMLAGRTAYDRAPEEVGKIERAPGASRRAVTLARDPAGGA